ncbi:Leucine-rich repeat family protein [Perilla frutescens var. frutescens]|nr:Leucine-rich repeat family protein [Perilla frutescens var. frutescens]
MQMAKIVIIILTTILLGEVGSGANLALPFAPPPLGPAPLVTDLIFADERLAAVFPIIQKFKNLITSDPFNITSTWMGSDICNYRGFYCENPPDNQSATALASIDFNGFHLTAPSLDGFLDQLPDIALFHANSNNFGGAISPAIAALPYLYELDISNNNFTGPFPAAVLAMASLTFLDLRFNSFSGAVPPQLFGKDLDALFINNNLFISRLPDIVGRSSTHIFYLTLANNKFFGQIPGSIVRALSNVSEILLLNNLLSGCLPYEVGLLKNAVVFDAGENRLTGPLPFSLGCMGNLEILNLAGNLFYGQVPEVVCSLEKVANLSLSGNYFTRVGPVCRRLMQNGILDVRRNCIRGLPLQRPAAECAAFFAVPRYCPLMPTYAHFPCRLPHFKNSASDVFELVPSPS